jgi:ParB family chromosome partitioning protein
MVRKALGRGLEALIPNARDLLNAPERDASDADAAVVTEPGEVAVAEPVPAVPGAPATLADSSVAQPATAPTISRPASPPAGPLGPSSGPGAVPAAYSSGAATDPKRAFASGRASVVIDVALDRIKPNPYQPRERFDEAETDELAASIRSKGVLQPVLLRRQGVGYELIAGERRMRAARRAGLNTVPAIVRDASDREVLELALIENEQRVELTPIESARSYARVLEEFQLTQAELADVLGRDRSTVSNLIRLLRLPDKVQAMIEDKRLSMGHARALLAVEEPKRCLAVAERTVKQGLSVRAVERMVQAAPRRRPPRSQQQDAELYPFEERLRRRFGTQVHIQRRNGRGRIEIEFYNAIDLERILEELGALRDA